MVKNDASSSVTLVHIFKSYAYSIVLIKILKASVYLTKDKTYPI